MNVLRVWLLIGAIVGFSVAGVSLASDLRSVPPNQPESLLEHSAEEHVTDIPSTPPVSSDLNDYIKREEMIPMRDGVELYTLILMSKSSAGPRPIVLERTPYGTATVLDGNNTSRTLTSLVKPLARTLIRNDYILVYQDVRGKHKSEGEYLVYDHPRGSVNTRPTDHTTDAYDTVEWLIANVEGNNGRVAITGNSYAGYLALMALLDPHPALRAAVPVNPVVDLWMGDDFYHNGAFRVSELEWIVFQSSAKTSGGNVPYGTYDVYPFFLAAGSAAEAGRRILSGDLPAWDKIGSHATYSAFWQERALDRLLARVVNRVPTLSVHSWFDQEDGYGATAAYAALERSDADNRINYFVGGPWRHGQPSGEGSTLGPFEWHHDTSLHYRENLLLPFLAQYLKDSSPQVRIAPVTVFDTGQKRWASYTSWPPVSFKSKNLFLNSGGTLSFDKRSGGDLQVPYDEYISDPAKPIPYRNRPIGQRFVPGSGWYGWLVEDQRTFESRPDVLVYVSEPLEKPLTVGGDVSAELFASTTGTDADWVVKLIDVFPPEYPDKPELGGYQLMVSGDILRGRYRNSFEHPEPIPADEVQRYEIRMPHAFHTFLPGHRIMVQIQSTWFPLYDRNPQSYVENVFDAPPQSYSQAHHRIYRRDSGHSKVVVQVLEE